MKKSNSLVASLLFLVASPMAWALPEKDTGNIGEIRQSILNITDFQRIYGDGWISMAGQTLNDSDLVKNGYWPKDTAIPDGRGIFLRSSNCSRDPNTGDPDGDMSVGQY